MQVFTFSPHLIRLIGPQISASPVDGDQWSASRSCRFTPLGKGPRCSLYMRLSETQVSFANLKPPSKYTSTKLECYRNVNKQTDAILYRENIYVR
jgi:hypothetical protein